jgi:hypothetical protein
MRPPLAHGATGPDVMYLQRVLGIPADGQYGNITATQVEAFQAACGLPADGTVGATTWAHVEELDRRMQSGWDGLSAKVKDSVIALGHSHPIQGYDWDDRGASPPGFIAGMGCAFALALTGLLKGNAAARVMAQAAGDPDDDALAYLEEEFEDADMENDAAGAETLRHLFVLLIGLGMRESSGRYCEGRDTTATNVEADTCEAALFQTSWNIASASPHIPPLLETYWLSPQGFLDIFAEGISPSASNLDCYGTGDGARYQWLSKYSPAFHIMVTALGLRTRRSHWGPIGRNEVEIEPMADDYLAQVERLVRDTPVQPPDARPELPVMIVELSVPDGVKLRLTVNGERILLDD